MKKLSIKNVSLKNIDGFDERQLNLINSCYKHGFWFALLVIFVNGLLVQNGIFWAYPVPLFYLSGVLVLLFFAIECCFRGIGIGKKFDNKLKFISPAAFFVGAIILLSNFMYNFAVRDGEIIYDSMLTFTGAQLVCGLMFLLSSVCSLIEIVYIRRVDKKANKAEETGNDLFWEGNGQ
jgi:hypothetical protein